MSEVWASNPESIRWARMASSQSDRLPSPAVSGYIPNTCQNDYLKVVCTNKKMKATVALAG